MALSRYSLVGPRVLASLAASARNANLLVEDATGQRYVLRCYRRNPSQRRILLQLRFQQHILSRGVPTSKCIPVQSGKLILDDGQHRWVLFSYVPGALCKHPSRRQVGESARWLARFHAAGQDFCDAEVSDDSIPHVRRWWIRGDAELHRLHALFGGRAVDRELAFLDRWQSSLVRDWPLAKLDQLPRSWVHGDYQSRNLTFVGDRLAGLFDFDALHRGFRLEDIAMALAAFGRERPGSERIEEARSTIFVREYRRLAGMTDGEILALPMMMVVVQARNAARYAIRERSGEDPIGALRGHVDRMVALTSQLARIESVCDQVL